MAIRRYVNWAGSSKFPIAPHGWSGGAFWPLRKRAGPEATRQMTAAQLANAIIVPSGREHDLDDALRWRAAARPLGGRVRPGHSENFI
jgi:hypothetical protein